MSYLTRKQVVLAKNELTYGADPSPDPAVNAILCAVPRAEYPADVLERDTVKADLSPMAHLIGIRYCAIEIAAELKPSGVLGDPPEIGPLLRACGLSETIVPGTSVRYDPVSEGVESATIWHHRGNNPDGIYTRIMGARGNIALTMTAGRWGVCTFTMQGLYRGPEVFALPTAIYNPLKPPQFLEVGATLGMYTPAISRFDLNMNNDLSRKIDVTQTHGVGEIWIVNRRPTGVIDPEIVSTATKDFWAEWLAGTEQALEVFFGTVGGSRTTIHIPKSQFLSAPTETDSEGLLRGDLNYKCNRTDGDDEFYILFD